MSRPVSETWRVRPFRAGDTDAVTALWACEGAVLEVQPDLFLVARTGTEDALSRLGCPKVNLQVRTGNADATAFYGSLGYAVEDRVSMGRPLV